MFSIVKWRLRLRHWFSSYGFCHIVYSPSWFSSFGHHSEMSTLIVEPEISSICLLTFRLLPVTALEDKSSSNVIHGAGIG
ncbi:hypothetical protein GDO86_019984 [Hymenochirus boettgeri]|uniref:Uncharacterized protein n=1 Tax=Hymenochirus boettgeri TaxID=247094 RepID=A0A8T2IG42_9PIPI|nr:hypothetical protein GDO86_019984 [Hymenochirus boettgeri]